MFDEREKPGEAPVSIELDATTLGKLPYEDVLAIQDETREANETIQPAVRFQVRLGWVDPEWGEPRAYFVRVAGAYDTEEIYDDYRNNPKTLDQIILNIWDDNEYADGENLDFIAGDGPGRTSKICLQQASRVKDRLQDHQLQQEIRKVYKLKTKINEQRMKDGKVSSELEEEFESRRLNLAKQIFGGI